MEKNKKNIENVWREHCETSKTQVFTMVYVLYKDKGRQDATTFNLHLTPTACSLDNS